MSLRAVIVDDSAEFVRAARSLLEREGITVVDSAMSGAEALRCTQEHDPDVVLLDVGLGEESGFDVAELLSRATGRRARVILISARPEQDLRDLIEASPAIGFVPHQFGPNWRIPARHSAWSHSTPPGTVGLASYCVTPIRGPRRQTCAAQVPSARA